MTEALRTNDDHCPHCNVSFQGAKIPKKDQYLYGATHFSNTNKIGVEIRGVYDGVLFWHCNACGGNWQRWTDGWPEMQAKAEKYMKDFK